MTFGRLSGLALTVRSSFSPKWQARAATLARGGASGVVKLRVRFSEYGVMRNLMIFAAILIGLGTFMAQMASKMAPAAATTAKQSITPAVTVAQVSARTLSIAPDPRGHFATDGRIDGQRINFMVDTGASVVALNETSAARFGLRPVPGDYTSRVTTANGTIKAARAHLAMIEIGGLTVRDVDALVLPDEALSENLLGLSFLSKLKRFEYANGKLLLEQ